jgi:hypothetical protein
MDFLSFISARHALIDPAGLDDRTSDASSLSTRRANFRQDVLDRDETCVLTSTSARLCQACHIIPHAKGDEVRPQLNSSNESSSFAQSKYMSRVVAHRGGGQSDISRIDDTRNALLVTATLHLAIGHHLMAFLQVSY